MKLRRWFVARRVLGLALLLGVLLVVAAPALADNDPLTPPRSATAPPYSGPPPLYDDDRFPPWNYTFEGDFYDVSGYNSIYFWMNQAMVSKAWLLKTSLRTVEYALTTNFFEPFSKRAAAALNALGNQFWSGARAPLVVGALSVTGMWALYLYLRGRSTGVWSALGGSLLILMLMAAILASGTTAVSSAVVLSRGVALEVYNGINRVSLATDKDPPLVVRSGVSAWKALVYEPWVTGEFGSNEGRKRFASASDNLDGGQFLAMQQDYRRKYVLECQPTSFGQQTTYCPWWNVQYLPRRMFLALSTFAAGVFYSGTLMFLAGSIIVAQLTMLFLVVLSPVWLLVALWWPGGGIRLVGRILGRALNALISQGVLVATLAVLLLLTRAVEEGFPTFGWMFQSLLLGALGALAFRYRYVWLAPFQASDRGREEAGFTVFDQMRSWLGRGRQRSAAASSELRGPSAAALPAYTALPDAVYRTEMVMPEFERVKVGGAVDQERSSPRDVFQTQMRTLRDQVYMHRETIRREQIEQWDGGPGGGSTGGGGGFWEEPAPTPAPAAARVSGGHQGSQNRTTDLTNLPKQRPQA